MTKEQIFEKKAVALKSLLMGILLLLLFCVSSCTASKPFVAPVESVAQNKSNLSNVTPPTKQVEFAANTAQIFLKAYASGNISDCDALNFTAVHVQCVVATAVSASGSFDCTNLWNASVLYSSRVQQEALFVNSHDVCYLELTMANGTDFCDEITDVTLAQVCKGVVA